jgi:cell migration-inducing and hyaluronan-binding protein
VSSGGLLELHGQRRMSWTRLAADARAGGRQLHLRDPVDWSPGDTIVLASTDFDPGQAETFRLLDVQEEGLLLLLNASLRHSHYGTVQSFEHPGMGGGPVQLDSAAEVALLSRNIIIQGDEDAEVLGSDAYQLGGHVKVLAGARRGERRQRRRRWRRRRQPWCCGAVAG